MTALPGVTDAGVATSLPVWNLATDTAGRETEIEDLPATWGEGAPILPWQVVSEGYFKALGVTLFDGRVLTASDRSDTPPVVVVNRARPLAGHVADSIAGDQGPGLSSGSGR